jgi:hypothetical protein
MNPADTIREATNLIRDAVGFALAEKNIPRAPTWTELVPAHLDAIAAALTELEADRDRYREALEQAVRTIDHWDATIGQPPDPPSAEEMLFAVRDLARAALDRHTKEQT